MDPSSSGTRSNKKSTPKPKAQDCLFFMADRLSCIKGAECTYRHSLVAQSQQKVCRNWEAGMCHNRKCRFRHPGKSGAMQNSPCPACDAAVCECGYGNPATVSFLEQQPHLEELQAMESQITVPAATFSRVSELKVRGRGVNNVSFSEDGSILAMYGQRGAASLWFTDRWTEHFSFRKSSAFGNSSSISRVAFGAGFLVAISENSKIYVWDMAHPPRPLLLHQSTSVTSIDATANKLCCVDVDGVQVWKMKRSRIKRVASVFLESLNGYNTANIKILRHARKTLIAVIAGTKVYVLNARTQLIMGTLEGHQNPVLSLCWDEDLSLLTTVSEEKINVWQLTGTTIPANTYGQLKSTIGNPFTCAVFHPFISQVIVLGLEKNIAIWKIRSTDVTNIGDGKVHSLAAAANMLASCHQDVVKIWRM